MNLQLNGPSNRGKKAPKDKHLPKWNRHQQQKCFVENFAGAYSKEIYIVEWRHQF